MVVNIYRQFVHNDSTTAFMLLCEQVKLFSPMALSCFSSPFFLLLDTEYHYSVSNPEGY